MSQPQYDTHEVTNSYGSKSKSPVAVLLARVGTLVSLIISLAILKTNDVTNEFGRVLSYKNFHSYKYMFYVMIVGVAYTLLQLPFAVFYMKTKKHLINSFAILKFSFYADKVTTFLLATGAGAGFGMTMDVITIYNSDNQKIHDFLTMGYIPASFLLIGCLTSEISFVYSSLALSGN